MVPCKKDDYTTVYSVFHVLFIEEKSGRASGPGNEKFVRSNDVLMRQRASCAEEGVDGRPVAPSSFLPSARMTSSSFYLSIVKNDRPSDDWDKW